VGGSVTDQFQQGAPSYSTGLRLEIPLQNRVAKARFQRRALELRQFQNQFKTTLAALQLEVEIAAREAQTSHREIAAKRQAMQAAEKEVEFIERRWQLLAGDDRVASLVLEDLLSAQERLADQEFEYLSSEVTYNLAMVELQRVMGTLLQIEGITTQREQCQGIPSLSVRQPLVVGAGEGQAVGPEPTLVEPAVVPPSAKEQPSQPPPYVSP
jgi:outer membrane protein TolC